ncbi:MAG: glycosyltransferase [Acidobacteria bacterium]|nr:glycosyltransferase [Acidobacteriota bacterium]
MLLLFRRLLLFALTVLITPILALLALTILFFNAVHLLTRFTRRPVADGCTPLPGLASIIILNWNGKELLEECIPSVLEAVRYDGRPHEVMVVDNGSTDGSVEFLRHNFPEVRIVALPENLGFAEGNNAGVRAAAHDVVILLNNDMVVDRGFLRPLLDGFGPKTFAVTSQIYFRDPSVRREETGRTTAIFRRGMVDYSHRPIPATGFRRRYLPAFWAGGGSSAFHKRRFLMLGGFDSIYGPAYVEDVDLSYQAWKAGWEILFAPASVVHHKHRASSARRFSPSCLQCLIQRNQLFFIWKNLRGWRMLLLHCAFLPWNCYRLARDHGLGIWACIVQGILRFPAIQISRLGPIFRAARSDTQIFRLFRQPAVFFSGEGADLREPDPDSPGVLEAKNGAGARPRILWVTAYIPHVGRHAGAGRMYHLLKRIAAHYRVTLLTYLEHEEERTFLADLEPLCEEVRAVLRHPPTRWPLFAYEPFDEFHTPEMEDALRDILEDSDFRLIQLEYTQMASYADRGLRIPTILTKHEVDFAACARRARTESGVLRRLRWFYNYLQVLDREVKLLRRVDGAICMTAPDAEVLRRYCADVPLHVLNTGVDLEYFAQLPVLAAAPRLVFVGAFQHVPNVDAMLHFCRSLFPRIRAVIPGAQTVIVGSNPTPAVLSLADIPGVEVTGTVPDIRPYMASAAVYIVPLRLGVGIRGKILEAWGMGLPVVATPVACSGLRAEDGRNILVADPDERFAEAVTRLLKDPGLRQRLGDQGRRTAEAYYSWDAAAGALLDLYRSYEAARRSRSRMGS